MIFRQPIDPVATGLCVPLRTHVLNLRQEAEEADWQGNTDKARACEKEADRAIAAGEDPVPLF